MSLVYGGACVKYGENENSVMYEYYAYDLNEEELRNTRRISDGVIKIDKSAFAQPETHQKYKYGKSGKSKLIIKRVKWDAQYIDYLLSGKVELVSGSLRKHDYMGFGRVGLTLISRIFDDFRRTGNIPHRVSVDW